MSEWWTYRLSSFLLFSPRTYHRLFELYNRAVFPAQLLALGLGLWILLSSWRGTGGPRRAVPAILAACWLFVAVAFFALRYASINFAGLTACDIVEATTSIPNRTSPTILALPPPGHLRIE